MESVTFGQIAVIIGDTLSRFGLPAEHLDDSTMVNLVQAIKEALTSKDVLSWDSVVRDIKTESQEVVPLLPQTDFEMDDCRWMATLNPRWPLLVWEQTRTTSVSGLIHLRIDTKELNEAVPKVRGSLSVS